MFKIAPKSRKTPRFSPQFIRRLSSWLVLTTALTLAVRPQAALFWDSDGDSTNNGTAAGLGGSGDWTTAAGDTSWWNGLSTLPNQNQGWDSTTAIFTGTAGQVDIAQSTINAAGLVFNTTGYVIGNKGIATNVLNLTGTAAVVVNGIGSTARIDAAIGGSAGLVKSGNGSLVLTNNSNTYTGDTVINDGAVVITDQAQLGLGTTAISVNGLANTGNPGFSGGQLILNGGITGLTINREISVTGRGTGAANAGGALVSVGNNTLNGDLVISSTGSEGRVVATHGTTTINGGVQLGTGAVNYFLGNGNFIISGVVTGFDIANDRLIKSGTLVATTLWLQNANNNFAETVRPDSGTIRVSDNGALGASTASRAIDFASGGRLEIHTDAPNFDTRNVHVRAVTGLIYATRAFDGAGLNKNVQFGNLEMDNGTLQYDNRNGYNLLINAQNGAGGTTTWAGAGNAAFTNNADGFFKFDGSIAHNEATARTFTVGGNGDTIITGSYLGLGGGAHLLTKNGNGILTIQGTASTYTGVT
ncbi:MAG: autotransporter-associated beta strand repeat-containing protein, partial [Opitutaceae bacterium]